MNAEKQGKLNMGASARGILGAIFQSRTEAPVRNPRLSPEESGMYIQQPIAGRLRTRDRARASRRGIKVAS